MKKIVSLLRGLKTITDIIRVRNALISFLGVYVGAILFSLGAPLETGVVVAAAVSAALILGGGNALNDYFDLEIDRVNQPKRPIPSGRITRSDAFMLSMALFLVGLGTAKAINDTCLAIAAFNTLLLIVYAKYGKRMLVIANVCISYLVSSVFIFGAAAVHPLNAPLNPYSVKLTLVLTVCSFLINLSREIIKDVEDVEGDRKAYSRTIPIVLGEDAARKMALICTAGAIVASAIPVMSPSPGFNELIYAIFILGTDAVLIASTRATPAASQRLIILGMTLALLAFLLAAETPNILTRL